MLSCKEAEKMVIPFLEHQLEPKQLKQYCEHVRTCKQCKEDLEINYLVHECLDPENNLPSYNLRGQLEQKLQDAEHYLRNKRLQACIHVIVSILAGLGLASVLFLRFIEWVQQILLVGLGE